MADEKPKAPAPAAKPERDWFQDLVIVLFVLFLLGSVITSITNAINSDPLFRLGWSGLTRKGITLAYTRPIASLFNPIGASVIATDDPTAVLDDAGGRMIGSQKFGAHGKIIGGPVTVGGVTYYKVDFDNPPDGWVAEDRIAYEEQSPSLLARIILFIWEIITYAWYLLWLVAVLILCFIVYEIKQLTAVRVNVRAKLSPPVVESASTKLQNPKWQRVLTHVESLNESDWRFAVIEADIMLSELLDTMQLSGDSIGEKLKGVERSDFTTLDLAWEAHKIRNDIAHEGASFKLTQREARRVINLYEQVFKEFQVV